MLWRNRLCNSWISCRWSSASTCPHDKYFTKFLNFERSPLRNNTAFQKYWHNINISFQVVIFVCEICKISPISILSPKKGIFIKQQTHIHFMIKQPLEYWMISLFEKAFIWNEYYAFQLFNWCAMPTITNKIIDVMLNPGWIMQRKNLQKTIFCFLFLALFLRKDFRPFLHPFVALKCNNFCCDFSTKILN